MGERHFIEQFNLRSKLKFNIDDGHVWFGENRMLLLHTKALAVLREELFRSLSPARARSALIKTGFRCGELDAELATKQLGLGDDYDVFQIGPELHAFEGHVKAIIEDVDIDWESGRFYGRVNMHHSWEAEASLQQRGVSNDPECWTLVGYASGFVSTFFKRFIVFREEFCVCKGDPECIVVGKPAEEWNDEAYIDLFKSEQGTDSLFDVEEQLQQLRGQRPQSDIPETGRLVGQSPAFRKAFELVQKASTAPINVLLLGETGVGKEMFAQWLHEHSDRSDKPFVAINCGAIPNELIESELFGVRRGAYTGAQDSRPGRFERADGGTLFLDEVGDLSASAQVKLLRVLQTGEIERLGDDKTRKVDVRLIAATNVDLRKAVEAGEFRADLFYRIATYPVEIPPLRRRQSDIPLLVDALLQKYSPLYDKHLAGITDAAMQALKEYPWPGNVRELENLIERAVLLAPDRGMIELEHLFSGGDMMGVSGAGVDAGGQLGDLDNHSMDGIYEYLLDSGENMESHIDRIYQLAVKRAGGNLTHAAEAVGVSRRQLAYRIKQIGG